MPLSASLRTMPRPMPREPPVTNAVFHLSCCIGGSYLFPRPSCAPMHRFTGAVRRGREKLNAGTTRGPPMAPTLPLKIRDFGTSRRLLSDKSTSMPLDAEGARCLFLALNGHYVTAVESLLLG